MLSLRDFIIELHAHAPDSSDRASAQAGDVITTTLFGLDVVAVALPSDLLTEDRVLRINQLGDPLGDREALVVAVSMPRGGASA